MEANMSKFEARSFLRERTFALFEGISEQNRRKQTMHDNIGQNCWGK